MHIPAIVLFSFVLAARCHFFPDGVSPSNGNTAITAKNNQLNHHNRGSRQVPDQDGVPADSMKGDQGEPGPPGEPGDKGARGESGPKGRQGAKGNQGQRGENGESGHSGEKGIRGLKGQQGAQGQLGDKGEEGLQGVAGPTGEKGEVGPEGDFGEEGTAGNTGERGFKGEPAGELQRTATAFPEGTKGILRLIWAPVSSSLQDQLNSFEISYSLQKGNNFPDTETMTATKEESRYDIDISQPGVYKIRVKAKLNGNNEEDIIPQKVLNVSQESNECQSNPCNAQNSENCTDGVGSFKCYCQAGYKGKQCQHDIDECGLTSDLCNGVLNSTGVCMNTNGSYYCECDDGFAPNGIICSDFDECTEIDGMCDDGMDSTDTCENTIGSYYCDCSSGYIAAGTRCKDIDECSGNTHNCGKNAVCKNHAPSSDDKAFFKCSCASNYEGDGFTCKKKEGKSNSAIIAVSVSVGGFLIIIIIVVGILIAKKRSASGNSEDQGFTLYDIWPHGARARGASAKDTQKEAAATA